MTSTTTLNDFWSELANDSSYKDSFEISKQIADIVNAIVKARVDSGISQRDLALKCGLKQSAIARFESNKVIPRLDTIIMIANKLGVKIKPETPKKISYDAKNVLLDNHANQTNKKYFIDIECLNSLLNVSYSTTKHETYENFENNHWHIVKND